MTKPFQFSLRALLVAMLVVAIGCAIWTQLPVLVKLAIVIGTVGFLLTSPEVLFLPLAWIVRRIVSQPDKPLDKENEQRTH